MLFGIPRSLGLCATDLAAGIAGGNRNELLSLLNNCRAPQLCFKQGACALNLNLRILLPIKTKRRIFQKNSRKKMVS